jgi:acetyl-CoA C-acetyltransferase
VATDPRSPVAVGAAAVQRRSDELGSKAEALELMIEAVERAALDTGAPRLLRSVDTIMIPQGTWKYSDPGRLIAERLGAPGRPRTVLAAIGVLQQTLVTRACERIAAGAADVIVVVGGEAKHRSLRAAVLDRPAPDTWQESVLPDETLAPAGEVISRLEVERGLAVPARQYAIIETAMRRARGLSVQEHAVELAAQWAAMSAVAAANPSAWQRERVAASDLRHPSASNPLLAYPYTKLLCSQWNVDQAAAVILCSSETADRLGISRDRRVFPIGAAESNAMIPLSRRGDLHRCPAVALCGDWLRDHTGVAPSAAQHRDIYSCFPAAVRVQAAELGLNGDEPLTVTGGMTFAGGPLNNYSMQALAKMIDVLRTSPADHGLLTSVSGMLTKQGVSLWSATAPAHQFRSADVSSDAVRLTATTEAVQSFHGIATIAGYTVAFDKGTPVQAIAIATTPAGGRCVVSSNEPDVIASLVDTEWVGSRIEVTPAGGFTPSDAIQR